MLRGAMAECRMGNGPSPPTSGPVIDAEAKANIENHSDHTREAVRCSGRCREQRMPAEWRTGAALPPTLSELAKTSDELKKGLRPVLRTWCATTVTT